MDLNRQKCESCEGGVAALAEEEGHHPVLHVYYAKIIIEIWTHAINGLSGNDFILAAKIDGL